MSFMGLIIGGVCVDDVNSRVCCLVALADDCDLVLAVRGETTRPGVDVNNTHPSIINPDYNMIPTTLVITINIF